jgi:hypothetical protein
VASSQHSRESLVEVVLRAVLPVLLLACIAACARPPPPAPVAEAPAAVQHRLGTILAIRPLAAGSAEYIVREDAGPTVVVVQPDADGLAVGERVTLREQGRARITRAR